MKVIWETFENTRRLKNYRISCIIAGCVSCYLRMCKYLHLFYVNFLNCLIDFWHIFKVLKTHARGKGKRSTHLACVSAIEFQSANTASCWVLIMEIYAFQLARFLRFKSRSHFVVCAKEKERRNKGKRDAALRNNLHFKRDSCSKLVIKNETFCTCRAGKSSS